MAGVQRRRVRGRKPRPKPIRAEEFRAEVTEWVTRLRVRPLRVRVQPMTRKWGSCSAAGTVSFATALLAEPAEFRTFVIVHELLHLRVANHGPLFRSYLAAYLPGNKHQQSWQDGHGVGRQGYRKQAAHKMRRVEAWSLAG